MEFSQSRQAFNKGKQVQTQALGTSDRQQLVAHLQRSLVQNSTIYILPDGTFSKLQPTLLSSIHLTTSLDQDDILVLEAAQTFYSQNEFAMSISTIPDFVSWTTSNIFKPSDVITRLAILYGPPTNPGGGNTQLKPLLSLPSLRTLRLIFQDYPFKGLGPHLWLRPSIGAIVELQARPGLSLTLQLQRSSRGPDGKPEDIDADDHGALEDITLYLQPPTAEEERAVTESRMVIDRYRGPQSSHVNILVECGWSAEDSSRVVHELSPRVAVRYWMEKERLNSLASQDVEML